MHGSQLRPSRSPARLGYGITRRPVAVCSRRPDDAGMAKETAREASTTNVHVRALATSVRGLDTVFCCGGSVELPQPVQLRLTSGSVIAVERETWGRDRLVKRLERLCKPAPFGVGNETRHDPRVRAGGQLLAADAFKVDGIDLRGSGIMRSIRDALYPDDATLPEAELYALNVYGARGHFLRHKDTPRDPDVFGTLVACLPVEFSGGRLVLRHETTRSYDWGHGGYSQPSAPYRVAWAAFYGDVDHEVEPVRTGTRVTLTWLLRRGAGPGSRRRLATATETDLEATLTAALADPRFMPGGGTLAVPCVHLYADTPGLVKPSAKLSRNAVLRLKGRDRLVASAALRAGVVMRYRPYLHETCAGESWRLSREPTPGEVAIFDRVQLGASMLERLPIEHHARWMERGNDDDVSWIAPPPWQRAKGADHAEPAEKLLGELEYSSTDYFGNEGSDAAFYMSAALLATVPPATERKRTANREPRRKHGASDARL